MDPNHEIENFNELTDEIDAGETVSVDDFIKELEAKEKDLHITADTTIIEIAESFDDVNDVPAFMLEELAANGKKTVRPAVTPKPAAEPMQKDLEATVNKLREQIGKMEADRDEMFKTSQRRARDFETFKTRAERERKETFQAQVGNLATQMLPALDNLNRALDFAQKMADEKGDEFTQFFDGIVLVNQQVNDVFARMGVTRIPTVGEIFDPHIHEAVATEINDALPPNTVSEELLRGYRMGDKIIRHSMVKVSQPSNGSSAAPSSAVGEDDPGTEVHEIDASGTDEIYEFE
ncbi:MAG TPA: nucleotide exchange factor GrpE [Pyrinomonadaceae bacterium]|nr:nucleotide exchange factor GrpE [Pyrinomonadaceae bacterium]